MLQGLLKQTVKNIEKSNYYAKIKTKLLQAYIKMKPIEFIEVSIISGLTLASILYMLVRQCTADITGISFGIQGA